MFTTKSFAYKLLRGVDHLQVLFRLLELLIKVELHELLEALLALLGIGLAQGAFDACCDDVLWSPININIGNPVVKCLSQVSVIFAKNTCSNRRRCR